MDTLQRICLGFFAAFILFAAPSTLAMEPQYETVTVTSSVQWPSWIGRLDEGQTVAVTPSNSVYAESVSIIETPEGSVVLLERPRAYAGRSLNIPEEYRPLHYKQLQEQASFGLPALIIQTGGSAITSYWPLWIDKPDWLR